MLSNCGAGEDSWESLDSKEIETVNPKGNQPWILTGRIDAEAPILWPPDKKSQLIVKDPDAGKAGGQEENRMTEDETEGTTDSVDLNLSKLREIVKDREASCAAVYEIAKSQTGLSDSRSTTTIV